MSKSTKRSVATPVSAKRVRAAFAAGEFTAPDEALPSLIGGSYTKTGGFVESTSGLVRGRLNPAAIEAFNAQVKGEVYAGEKSNVEARTVEVPMFSPKTGRPVKPVTKTLAEVRAAAGVEGKKGRLSQADLHRAAVAFGSGEPKAAKA